MLGLDDKLGSDDSEGIKLVDGALLRVGRRDGRLDDEGNDVGCSVFFPLPPLPDFVGFDVGTWLGSKLG